MRAQVEDILLNTTAQAVDESATDQVVSREFAVSSRAIVEGLRIEVKLSSVTDGSSDSSISAKLQMSPIGGASASYADLDATNAKVSVGADGWFSIPVSPWNTNLATKFPLRAFGRVVVSTAAGDAATVSECRVIQPW